MSGSELGEFLRARRAQRSPRDAGLPYAGKRRVAGLRREEVAVLAGVNVDYYTRLEQGRESHPSAQVLDALCRALDLDPDAREHLHRLAGTTPDGGPAPVPRTVSPELRQLMDGYTTTPAFVLDRNLDVLASNALADALFAPFDPADNLARMVFLDPVARQFYARWEWTAQATVANLRMAAGSTRTIPACAAWWPNSATAASTSAPCGTVTRCVARPTSPSSWSTPTWARSP